MKLLVKKLFPFLILVFAVAGCTEQAREDSRQRRAELEKREKVAELLNGQFDLSKGGRTATQVAKGIKFDCRFKFRVDSRKNEVLIARLCESSPESANLGDILTPGNVDFIKNSGFEEVKLYDRTESSLIDSQLIGNTIIDRTRFR